MPGLKIRPGLRMIICRMDSTVHETTIEREIKMKHIKTLLFMGLFLSITLLGCSKLNRENYDRIKVGMDYQEIISIIGEPDTCDTVLAAKNCIWGDENKNITIKFIGDKVIIPSMKGI